MNQGLTAKDIPRYCVSISVFDNETKEDLVSEDFMASDRWLVVAELQKAAEKVNNTWSNHRI